MDKHLYETKFTDNIREESSQIFELIALVSFLGTMFLMLTQALLWFKYGIWSHFEALYMLSSYLPASFLGWLANPQSMLDFAELLNSILGLELSVLLVSNGVLSYILFKALEVKDPDAEIEETDISELPSLDDWQKDF